jgi:hypothetical protein
MSQPIIVNINLRQIRQDWCFKNANRCSPDLILYENAEPDQYGNHFVVKQMPPKELRATERSFIVGNARWMPQKGGSASPRPASGNARPMPKTPIPDDQQDDTSIPF